MTAPAILPTHIAKTDGCLEPFDGDRISHALFAASACAGRPNAFLARELADGVLYFLTAHCVADPLPLDELNDTIAKVVRELGHPILAQAFVEMRALARPAAESVDELLASDLSAAERQGLLHLFHDSHGVAKGIAGIVVPPNDRGDPGRWVAAIASARNLAIQYVALDSPEYLLRTLAAARQWADELKTVLGAGPIPVAVNLNCGEPPDWARMVAAGSLAGVRLSWTEEEDGSRRREISDLLAHSLVFGVDGLRIDWHLAAADFEPAQRPRLTRLAGWVADGASIGFVPDRPRKPIALAEGLDRDHPAVLAAIGIGLARLSEIVGSDETAIPARIGTLARLALSAGRSHRDALRRRGQNSMTDAFLIDRARIMVVPIDLDKTVIAATGQSSVVGTGLEFSKSILLALQVALLRDTERMPAVIDGPPPFAKVQSKRNPSIEIIPAQQQIRAAATIHNAIGPGTADIRLPDTCIPEEDIAELIEFAWQQPGMGRFRFSRRIPRQMTAGW